MLGLRHARLHILYINGDYDIHENRRDPPAPIYMLYELEFSTKELQQFWNNVMLKSRDKARKEVH
jgi:hypothetical protein